MTSLAIFKALGFSRDDVLSMPHWEVVESIEGFYRIQAQEMLGISEAVALGSGTIAEDDARDKLVEKLMIRAGFKKEKVSGNWMSGLQKFAGVEKF